MKAKDKQHIQQEIKLKFPGTSPEEDIDWEMIEISFKAGIKKVVDFIGEEPFEHNEEYKLGTSELIHHKDDCFACRYEAQLKEWGLE